MISSNPQDEAMLSERNEQDMFQSESSSDNEGDRSIDDLNQDSDDQLQQEQSYQMHQTSEKDENQAKIVKETCLEKIKGYIGFGSLLTSQPINNIFFIPISNKWSFKTQVIVTQIICTVISLIVFFCIKFIGQSIFQQIIMEWTDTTFHTLQLQQMQTITYAFLDLINVVKGNEESFILTINDLLQQNQLIWDKAQLISMEQQLHDPIQTYSSKINSSTLNYATYTYLNSTNNINTDQLLQIMSINYMIKYLYVTIEAQIYWIFNNGLMIQYPGINVTNIEEFKQYRRNIDNQKIVSSDFIYDEYLGQYLTRQIYPIYDSNHKIIGYAYKEKYSEMYQNLFSLYASSETLNYTLVLANNNNEFVTQPPDYLADATLQLLEMKNLSQFQLKYQRKSKTYPYSIYRLEFEEVCQFFSFSIDEFKIIFIYPFYLLQTQLDKEEDLFEQYDLEFTQRYLGAVIGVPLLLILIIIYFLHREIQPLVQLTQLAQLSLKNSAPFDEGQLKNIKGDGLISNLTQLFKYLMLNLNEMKSTKRKQIIEYYNQQTHPCNNKVKDVESIMNEVEKIKLLGDFHQQIAIPNLDD